jgi:hypothetical protein
VPERCTICLAFQRQLRDLEVLIGRILDNRERPADSLAQEHDSRHQLDELIRAAAEARALHERHKRTVHSMSA